MRAKKNTTLIGRDDMRLIRKEIANGIKAAVQQSGVSQNALAKALGVSSGTMSSWLSARTQPSLERFAVLCHIARASADSILGTPVRPSRSPSPIEAVRTGVLTLAMATRQMKHAEQTVAGWGPRLVDARRKLEDQLTLMRRDLEELEGEETSD